MTSKDSKLFTTILDSGIDIINKCANKARCGRCVVEFRNGEPDRYTDAEQQLIIKWLAKDPDHLLGQAGYRASCQIEVTHDMGIRVINRESEVNYHRCSEPITESINPEPIWNKGKPMRNG